MVAVRGLSHVLGLTSLFFVVYFWLALLLPHVWQPIFPGAGFMIVGCLLLSTVGSVSAGWLGSRRWYFVAVAALVTLLFIGLRMY